jgi:hypothetical protein
VKQPHANKMKRVPEQKPLTAQPPEHGKTFDTEVESEPDKDGKRHKTHRAVEGCTRTYTPGEEDE